MQRRFPTGLLLAIATLAGVCAAPVAAAESFLYVSNEDSGTISVIASPAHQVVETIPVGKRPRGLKLRPDGKILYVAVSGSPKCPPTMPDEECAKFTADKSADGIAEIDLQERRVLRTLPGGSDPEQFDVAWSAGHMVIANEDSNQASILDLAAGQLLAAIATGGEPEGVRISPDGKIAYVTAEADHSITLIDMATRTGIGHIEVGLRPREVVFSGDGSLAFVSAEIASRIDIIDVEKQAIIHSVPVGEGTRPMGMVLAPDESILYVANGRGRTVAAIDLATRQVTGIVDAGERPWGLAMSPDGKYLYTANGPSDDVTVIDRANFTVLTKIQVGQTPWGVVAGPVPE